MASGSVSSIHKTPEGLKSAERSQQLMPRIFGIASRLRTLARPSTFPEPLTGLFLCAELDQAVLSATVFQLGSNPVKATSDSTAIIGVLIDVKRFEQERPLIRAEMNGLGWFSHEWVRCLEWIDPVRFYKWSQGQARSAPINTNLSMTYSHFIWGSEPRGDGTFHPWEIFNVLPEIEPGKPCPENIALQCFVDAQRCNPGFQFVMTTKPKIPANALGRQCSSLLQ